MKETKIELNKNLQLTCDFDVFDSKRDRFVCRQLDVVDHWLTEEEAVKKILSYPVLLEQKKDLTEFFSKEKEMLNFLEVLFERYTVFLCKNDNHYLLDNKEEFREICSNSIREKELATFHIADLGLTIFGNYDLNMAFNFSNVDQHGIPIIEKILASFKGLYLLG